ncbi:transposase [Oryzomonas rubra]|uniref:Transposase n=2 Tax=Oryzomonas rubra TaxID=2509454 RepID=A0A5A9XHA2_9BACT|nr:transposase [Oryzomonas rubra]
MTFNPDIHHRRSIRLRDYDYTSAGAYFVTICTQGKECLFGRIDGEVMVANDAERLVESVWYSLPERFSGTELDAFVIMPNHVHFIVFLVGATLAPPLTKDGGTSKGAASSTPTLGSVVRAFKSISAIEVNRVLGRQGQPLWQRNYYERVVRDDGELRGFREYIQHNPACWSEDENNDLTT